jgi:hypothetical protein
MCFRAALGLYFIATAGVATIKVTITAAARKNESYSTHSDQGR